MALKNWFWPSVSIRKNALLAMNEAFWVTVAIAGFLAVWNAIDLARPAGENAGYGGFILAGIFGLAAVGIWFKSRVAAMIAFTLFAVTRLVVRFTSGPAGLILSVLAGIALFQGVRGAFAYHRLAPIPAGTPSVADSFAAMKQPDVERQRSEKS